MNTEQLTQTSIGLLEKLVAFDSVSRHSNLSIIAFIEDYLKGHGAYCTRIPSPDGQKSNLLARIGPETPGGIILSGHTDVVPVDGQQWDSDPFALAEREGKLYGRGTADMKSFIAVCLAMTPEFLKLNLKKPIWLAFSYDEEVGCLGAPHLLAHIAAHIPAPAFAIIGEPTRMQVVTAHKGVLSFETVVHGLEGHSSKPHMGVNAVQIACELVHFFNTLAPEMRDARFDPPFSTIHVGVISGGTARNIIPKECRFQWEIRPLPGDRPELLIARFEACCEEWRTRMKKTFAGADIVTRPMSRMTGVTLPANATQACQTVMRCALTNQEHCVSYGTEAGIFNDHGIPAIICGPGDIEQAHKPNEYIEREQIGECVAFMLRLADEISEKTLSAP